ncbi:MAG TPA: pyridoxal-phosphate dependent enzyme [Acetobacteraceae bacterium]|jgi:threonine synthase|nr:pyridoxal-phosphate dependent enzyme [Acetobacteraceae bacterium]
MSAAWLACTACGARHPCDPLFRCPSCGGELSLQFDLDARREAFAATWRRPGNMWRRFGSVLPPCPDDAIVTLGEGGTPLVRGERLARRIGLENLWFKLEGCNPTGSFKDRQMSVAVSAGRAWGRHRYATVSSGNVGVALSAYCARAGFEAHVWVAEDTAAAKLRQITVYGAQVYLAPPSSADMDAYLALYTGLQDFAVRRGWVPMISARPVNPYMVEGSKTIAFEIAAELGAAPDDVFACVGGGGCLGGIHKGFAELIGLGQAQLMPRVHGGQRGDHGHAPIDRLGDPEWRRGAYRPLDGAWAWESIRESGGSLYGVSGAEITRAQALLAAEEGIFAEPQGAYATAALLQAAERGEVARRASIVCVVTGAGLKDMQSVERFADAGIATRAPIRVRGLTDEAVG